MVYLSIAKADSAVRDEVGFVVGVALTSMSLILLAVQLLSPFNLVGALVYSLSGIALLSSTERGSPIVNKAIDGILADFRTFLFAKVSKYSSVQFVADALLSFLLVYVSQSRMPSVLVERPRSHSIKERTTQRILYNALSSIKEDLPELLRRGRSDLKATIVEVVVRESNRVAQSLSSKAKEYLINQARNLIKAVRTKTKELYAELSQMINSSSALMVTSSNAPDFIVRLCYRRITETALISVKNLVSKTVGRITGDVAPCDKQHLGPTTAYRTWNIPQLYFCNQCVFNLNNGSDAEQPSREVKAMYVAIVLSNIYAMRMGIHASRAAWLRSIIFAKLQPLFKRNDAHA